MYEVYYAFLGSLTHRKHLLLILKHYVFLLGFRNPIWACKKIWISTPGQQNKWKNKDERWNKTCIHCMDLIYNSINNTASFELKFLLSVPHHFLSLWTETKQKESCHRTFYRKRLLEVEMLKALSTWIMLSQNYKCFKWLNQNSLGRINRYLKGNSYFLI